MMPSECTVHVLHVWGRGWGRDRTETISHMKSYIHITCVALRDLQLVKLYRVCVHDGGGAGEARRLLSVTKCYVHIKLVVCN